MRDEVSAFLSQFLNLSVVGNYVYFFLLKQITNKLKPMFLRIKLNTKNNKFIYLITRTFGCLHNQPFRNMQTANYWLDIYVSGHYLLSFQIVKLKIKDIGETIIFSTRNTFFLREKKIARSHKEGKTTKIHPWSKNCTDTENWLTEGRMKSFPFPSPRILHGGM